MGELFREILNLFRGDESPFWKFIKFVAVLTIGLLFVVSLESAMGLVTIGRLERKINLLNELNALTETGMGSRDQLVPLFNEAVSDLEQFNPDLRLMALSILPDDYEPAFIEILAGAAIWILMGLAMLKTTKGGKVSKLASSGLVILFGLVIGVFTDLIIVSQNHFLTLVLNVICGTTPLILLGFVLMRHSQVQNQSENSETSDNPEN